MRLRSASSFSLLPLAAASLLFAACGTEGAATNAAEDDVTSGADTAVKEQTIGNCWLYATAAWTEALHLNATGQTVDVSEGYWSFWYWFEEVVGGDLALRELDVNDPITEGGWWGVAAEIIGRYGWMREQDFRSDAVGTKATWHKEAVEAMNASLQNGLLADPLVRTDRVKVLRELARIWKLDAGLLAELEKVFGVGAVKTFGRGASPSTRIQLADTLRSIGSDGKKVVTLADVLGKQEVGSTIGEGRRTGAEAWSELRYQFANDDAGAKTRRAILANVQNTLHHKTPVPIAWGVGNAVNGVYGGTQSYVNGLHESVLVDYAATDVPGAGALELGVPVTDEKILEAALDPATKITHFRLKNSWGSDPFYSEEEWRQFGYGGAPPTEAKSSYLPAKPGYNDLDIAYVDSRLQGVESWYGLNSHNMLAVALPNALRFPVARQALKRAFVTFDGYRASDFSVTGGADGTCASAAKKSGLTGSWAALITQGTVDSKTTFPTEGVLYRAIHLKRGTYRASPIALGAYPGVTQYGVATTNDVWSTIDAGGACATNGTATSATGATTSVACNQRRSLICVER